MISNSIRGREQMQTKSTGHHVRVWPCSTKALC